MLKLVRLGSCRHYQLIPKDFLRDRNLPVRFRKKESDPVKSLRAEVKQARVTNRVGEIEALFQNHLKN